MTKPAASKYGFHELGDVVLDENEICTVTIDSAGAGGVVHADAVQLIKVE